MKKYLFIVLCFLLVFSNCEIGDTRYSLRLRNDDSQSIGCYFGIGGISAGIFFPDTTITEEYKYVNREVKPSGRYFYDSSIKWKKVFEDLPMDTMSIFIFDTDTLNKYSWDLIRSQYKVLKRYDLSFKDIEALDYEIPYPPNELMKDMKMWP